MITLNLRDTVSAETTCIFYSVISKTITFSTWKYIIFLKPSFRYLISAKFFLFQTHLALENLFKFNFVDIFCITPVIWPIAFPLRVYSHPINLQPLSSVFLVRIYQLSSSAHQHRPCNSQIHFHLNFQINSCLHHSSSQVQKKKHRKPRNGISVCSRLP